MGATYQHKKFPLVLECWILTFWVTTRKRRALNCGKFWTLPGNLAGSECGDSSTVVGFTIFSTSISQASRNSPVPSGKSECSNPSATGTLPPIERAQLKVLNSSKRKYGERTLVFYMGWWQKRHLIGSQSLYWHYVSLLLELLLPSVHYLLALTSLVFTVAFLRYYWHIT